MGTRSGPAGWHTAGDIYGCVRRSSSRAVFGRARSGRVSQWSGLWALRYGMLQVRAAVQAPRRRNNPVLQRSAERRRSELQERPVAQTAHRTQLANCSPGPARCTPRRLRNGWYRSMTPRLLRGYCVTKESVRNSLSAKCARITSISVSNRCNRTVTCVKSGERSTF